MWEQYQLTNQLIDTKQTLQIVLKCHIFEEFKIKMWYSKILSKLHEPLASAFCIQNFQILIQDKNVILGRTEIVTKSQLNLKWATKYSPVQNHSYDYWPNWTPPSPITIRSISFTKSKR